MHRNNKNFTARNVSEDASHRGGVLTLNVKSVLCDFLLSGSPFVINPHNIKYLKAYALLTYDFNEYKKAKPIFVKLFNNKDFRKSTTTRYFVVNYAIILQHENKLEESLNEYKKSLLITGNDKKIFWAYIGALSLAKKYTTMEEEYLNFEKEKGYIDAVKYKLCKEFLASKKFKKSKQCYLELLRKKNNPNHGFVKQSRVDLSYVTDMLSKVK